MSITNQTTKSGPFTITGSPQVIPTGFAFQQASDLLVLDYGTSAVTHDPALVLVLNSDYTVTGGGYNSANQMDDGSITVVSTGTNAVQVGDNIIIMRAAPLNQTQNFGATGPITVQLLEQMGDKLATLSQQVNELGERSLHFENFETQSGLLSRTARAGFLLGFDDNGNIEYTDGSGGGGGNTYTAGAGLQLVANEFSILPDQTFANLTVTNPIIADLAGNADTATALETARTINGVAFDGTANITVTAAAGTLTGSALPASITSAPGLLSAAVGTFGTMATQNANAVAVTGGTITGMPSPSAGSDVATKTYVDNTATGIVQRAGCQVATTANITLSGEQTIDGVLTATSRILVKNQSAPAENGIYVTAAGAWARATDSNTAAELLVGYYYFVSLGTTQGATGWTIQTAPTLLGTDPVVFGQFSASTTYTAGFGLGLAGNVFSLNSTQTGLTINASAFNGTLGATVPSTVAATTIAASGTIQGTNLILKTNQLNESITNGTASVLINYDGYAGGTTQFRDFGVYDGKNAAIATFTGSTKATVLAGTVQASSADAVVTAQFRGASGKLGVVGYYDATLGAVLGSTNLAGSVGQPLTLTSSNMRVLVGGGLVGNWTTGGLDVTGAISVNSNTNVRTTKNNFHVILNVKDYGATGDGSTNDQVAIAAACTAMTDYSALYFPPGNYRVTSGIFSFASVQGITLFGEGATITNDSGASGANTFVFENTCSDVEVRDLRFVGTATVRGSGIHIRSYCSNVRISNCYFTRCSDFAVHISNDTGDTTTSNNIVVDGNVFEDTLGDGVHVSSATNVVISNNVFYETGDDSIGIVRDSLTASGIPSRINIVGNVINRAGYGTAAVSGMGIRIAEANDVLVSGNLIDYTYQAPIVVERYLSTSAYNARIQITGNKVLNGNQLAGQLGSIGASFCNGVTISDNKIDDPANGNGIAFLDCNDLVIQGNQLRNIPSRGIGSDDSTTTNVAANCYRVYILNNSVLYTLANEAIYAVAPTGKTINNLMIAGNVAGAVPAGNYIYYDRVTTGKIYNNLQSASNTVGAGGTVSAVTTGNNN